MFAFLNKNVTTRYKITDIETVALQIRIILELIALGSLAANRSVFEDARQKFTNHWHPNEILKDIERLNPQFFPHPMQEVPSRKMGAEMELIELTEGSLTRDELVEVHGRCGNVLHARSPFRSETDYDDYLKNIPRWVDRTVKLLDCHQIRLLDNDEFYLIHMKDAVDGKAHLYLFKRLGA